MMADHEKEVSNHLTRIDDLEEAIKSDLGTDIPELLEKKNFLGKWATFFIERYRVTYLLIIVILIWGAGKYAGLQREAQPKVTIPFAYINTMYVGASPQEVEMLITDPIEKKMEELEGVKQITSSSGFGYSTVFLEFESGIDVQEKVREMRETLSDVSTILPAEAETPIVSDMKTGESPILVFSVSGEQDRTELQHYAKNIKKEIEKINGVREVTLLGNVNREISITVDPQKLSVYAVSLQDIKNAITLSNINLPGGDIELSGKSYNIRTVGRFDQIQDMGNIVIKYTDHGQIYLKDIAVIDDGYEKIKMHARRSDALSTEQATVTNAIVVAVKKKESADDIKVRDRIVQMLEEKKTTLLPDDIKFELISDKADYVDEQLGSVIDNAKSGLFLVIVVLFLFIGLGESLIVSFVIPLSIFTAFGLMNVSGMTLNNISMFSLVLAIGMLVDNGIVIMENIDRLRNKGLSARLAAEVATNQIAPAVLASTLTTLAAFFPMLMTSGITGDFIRPIPMTVIFTLTASFFVAITITPSICSQILKRRPSQVVLKQNKVLQSIVKIGSVITVFILSLYAFKDWDKTGFEQFGILAYSAAIIFAVAMIVKQFAPKKKLNNHPVIHQYSRFLYWVVSKTRRKLMVIGTIILLFVLSVSMIPTGILKVEMFGAEDYSTIYVTIKTPTGSTLSDTLAISEQVEKTLYSIQEIKNFMSYVGHQGSDIWSDLSVEEGGTPNEGRVIIELYDAQQRDRTSMDIAEQIRNDIKNIAGAEIKVRELESGAPTGPPISLRIKGENLDDLKKTADDFVRILDSIDGIRDIQTSIGEGSPELQIKVDKIKAAALGLDDMSVALSIRNAIHGVTATTFRDDQDEIDIVIRTTEDKLRTIRDLDKIFFYTRRGTAIPLSQVAQVIEGESVLSISHEDGMRRVWVNARIDDKKLTAAEANAKFNQKIAAYSYPDGIAIKTGGEMEALGDSFGDMMMNMIIAAILVYIILAIQFNSLSQPIIILLSVPMALIGVMPGLFITGNAFGFVSFIGVVALVGIAVNDAIVLVDYINYLRSTGMEMKEAIKETGVTRFLPVMATTITTAGGILPITLKQPFFAPLGISLIFGLCMATVLTLVVVPTIYSLLEGYKLNKKIKKELKQKNAMNLVEGM